MATTPARPPLQASRTVRDGYIDCFKGCLILWVIHIHTVFWSGTDYVSEGVRQASLLIDVPTFFFISGYLTKPLHFMPAVKRVVKQFKQLYFNYLGLSLVLFVPVAVLYAFTRGHLPDFPHSVVSMLSVLKLRGDRDLWRAIPVYRGSFWYLWVYFSLFTILPFFISRFQSRRFRITILAALLIVFQLSSALAWDFNFFLTDALYLYFYAFIYLLGMAYRLDGAIIPTRFLTFSFFVNLSFALMVFLQHQGSILNLQDEKLLPTVTYLLYSLLLIHLFVVLQRRWAYPHDGDRPAVFSWLEWCGRNSYIIYLVQGVVTSIPYYFSDFLLDRVSPLATYAIVIVINVLFTLLFTGVYIALKDRWVNRVNQTIGHT